MKNVVGVTLAALIVLVLSFCTTSAFGQAASLMYVSNDGGVKGQNVPLRADSTGRAIVASAPATCAASSPHTFTSLGAVSTTVAAASSSL